MRSSLARLWRRLVCDYDMIRFRFGQRQRNRHKLLPSRFDTGGATPDVRAAPPCAAGTQQCVSQHSGERSNSQDVELSLVCTQWRAFTPAFTGTPGRTRVHPGVPTLEVGVSLMLQHGDAIRHADVRGADAAHCVSSRACIPSASQLSVSQIARDRQVASSMVVRMVVAVADDVDH